MREGGKRGISLPDESAERPKTLPPFYWAGFVLSGDWRTLASIQAANGVIIFGWTTALIFYFIQKIYKRH